MEKNERLFENIDKERFDKDTNWELNQLNEEFIKSDADIGYENTIRHGRIFEMRQMGMFDEEMSNRDMRITKNRENQNYNDYRDKVENIIKSRYPEAQIENVQRPIVDINTGQQINLKDTKMHDKSQSKPKEYSFTQGYNDGYTMGKYDRPTAYKINQMTKGMKDDYAQGFRSGEVKSRGLVKEFQQEAKERCSLDNSQTKDAFSKSKKEISEPSKDIDLDER